MGYPVLTGHMVLCGSYAMPGSHVACFTLPDMIPPMTAMPLDVAFDTAVFFPGMLEEGGPEGTCQIKSERNFPGTGSDEKGLILARPRLCCPALFGIKP